MSNKDHDITLRGSVFWFYKRYPTDVVRQLGKFCRKSLKTSDIKVARSRRDVVLAEYQRDVAEARGSNPDPYIIEMARGVRRQVLREGNPDSPVLSAFEDMVEALYHRQQINQHEAGMALTISNADEDVYFLYELLDKYFDEVAKEVTSQTLAEKKRYIKDYKEFLGGDYPLSSLLDVRKAHEYLNDHILPKDISEGRKAKALNNVKTFYKWCIQRGYSTSNPFTDLTIRVVKGRKGRSNDNGWRAWDDSEIEKVLAGLADTATSGGMKKARFNSKRLIPMVIIAIYTGMRIDEIAELQAEDVTDAGMGIREGKNRNAIRTVPVSKELKPLVDALVESSKDGYLIPELLRGGPDKKRSWEIQKAFGRRKTNLGFGSDTVFHGFRSTAITKLKQANVALFLAKEIVGHELDDLTYGHYGEDMRNRDKQEAVNEIAYNFNPLEYAQRVGLMEGGW